MQLSKFQLTNFSAIYSPAHNPSLAFCLHNRQICAAHETSPKLENPRCTGILFRHKDGYPDVMHNVGLGPWCSKTNNSYSRGYRCAGEKQTVLADYSERGGSSRTKYVLVW